MPSLNYTSSQFNNAPTRQLLSLFSRLLCFLSQSLPGPNKILMFIRIFGGFVILKFSSKVNVVHWSFSDILHYLFLYLCNINSIQESLCSAGHPTKYLCKWITEKKHFCSSIKSQFCSLYLVKIVVLQIDFFER